MKAHKQHPKNPNKPACQKRFNRNAQAQNYEIFDEETWERVKKEQPEYLCKKCRKLN